MSFVDQQLAPHFKLSEYLMTSHVKFQELNRQVTPEQIAKLREVALLEEVIREVIGRPLENHSGYRCPALNSAIGSSGRSQHLLCEAVDFSRWGVTDTGDMIDHDFDLIVAAARAGKLRFGQLIKESAARQYSVARWIHVSLGAPWRPAERCGQLLSMQDGVYTSLGRV